MFKSLLHLLTRSEGWCQVWHEKYHAKAWYLSERRIYCALCERHRKPLRDEETAW